MSNKNMFCNWICFAVLLVSVLAVRDRTLEGKTACQNLKLVTREEWLARPPLRTNTMLLPLDHVIILHTASTFCKTPASCTRQVQFAQDFHLDERGWWDIGYSFMIGGDGRVYVGRGWTNNGAFAVNYNGNSIGIAFLGNFMKDKPTEPMLNAAQDLINCGIYQGYLTPTVEVHGHRDVACTLSPGDNLYAIIRTWKNFKGGRLMDYNCFPLEDKTITTTTTSPSGEEITVHQVSES